MQLELQFRMAGGRAQQFGVVGIVIDVEYRHKALGRQMISPRAAAQFRGFGSRLNSFRHINITKQQLERRLKPMFSDHAPYSTLAPSQRENQFFWHKNG